MPNRFLGSKIYQLEVSPLEKFFFAKHALSSFKTALAVSDQYNDKCDETTTHFIRKNLGYLFKLHDITVDQLVTVSELSKAEVEFLLNIVSTNEGASLNTGDYVWMAALLTAYTGHTIDDVFNEGFAVEAQEHALKI